jgi:hypothetical protein
MSKISDRIPSFIFLVFPPSFVTVIGALIMAGVLYHPDNSVGEFWVTEIFGYYVVVPVFLSLVCAPIFGIYPAFIKTEKLFQRYSRVVFEYQFLKKFLFIAIILLIGMIIHNVVLPHEYYSFWEFDNRMFGAFLAIVAFVTLGATLRFVTQVRKKEFRFYFAKTCCKIMAEKEDFEKLIYLELLLESYNKYLQRKLKVSIKDLSEIYSIILCKEDHERNQIISEVCKVLNTDKMSLANYLLSLYKVPDSKFYSIESLFQQLKLPATIAVTAVPIIISIIQAITTFI